MLVPRAYLHRPLLKWKKFYPGLVAKVNGDATFDLVFDDGDKRSGVSAACIRAAEDARSASSAPSSAATAAGTKPAFAVGQKITAKVGKVSRKYWVGAFGCCSIAAISYSSSSSNGSGKSFTPVRLRR